MIIAIDTEENLLALGVGEVILASSNDAALMAIDGNLPDFALLDFNLGGETSEPIARALDAQGVAFAFATGYGEVEGMTSSYRNSVGVLHKPYSKDDVAHILAQPVPGLKRPTAVCAYLGRAIRQSPAGSNTRSAIVAAYPHSPGLSVSPPFRTSPTRGIASNGPAYSARIAASGSPSRRWSWK